MNIKTILLAMSLTFTVSTVAHADVCQDIASLSGEQLEYAYSAGLITHEQINGCLYGISPAAGAGSGSAGGAAAGNPTRAPGACTIVVVAVCEAGTIRQPTGHIVECPESPEPTDFSGGCAVTFTFPPAIILTGPRGYR